MTALAFGLGAGIAWLATVLSGYRKPPTYDEYLAQRRQFERECEGNRREAW